VSDLVAVRDEDVDPDPLRKVGDPIRLNAADFDRLSKAFFAETESKFVQ
jgi:hypothetical protein